MSESESVITETWVKPLSLNDQLMIEVLTHRYEGVDAPFVGNASHSQDHPSHIHEGRVVTAHTMQFADKQNVWAKLSAPINQGAVSWRQDGKVYPKDGKFFARFVCYVEANTVRERLDTVVPGEWDVTLEMLPPTPDTSEEDTTVSFKARINVLGVMRENVGMGRDYKSAATDAFKRAAVQFGIGSELYDYEQNWVEMDSAEKNAKPIEDPQAAYNRRYGSGAKKAAAVPVPQGDGVATQPSAVPTSTLTDMEVVSCPKCGGRMWDNRLTKRNPKAPDYKCQNRSCDGVIWPPKTATAQPHSIGGPLVGEEEELPY